MSGKLLGSIIVLAGLIAGGLIYWLQIYAFYDQASSDTQIRLTNMATGEAEVVLFDSFQGIDANSSPLRFRGCFTTTMSLAMLTETYEVVEGAEPRVAPGWFDCFDASEIGQALTEGGASAFLGEKDIQDGIDRVVAVFPDGRGFAWHQLNEKYDE